jgi:hypothetical protein
MAAMALHDEMREFSVTFIAQKQRLSAISDDDEDIVGNAHHILLGFDRRRTCRASHRLRIT